MSRGDDRPTDIEADEGFAQRWSRRKREAEGAPEPSPPTEVEPSESQPETEPQSPGDEDMPPLNSLGPNSDISEFFSPRVSEALRQAALQRIFRQPKFNYSDGLDVYCSDYRHFKPLGEIVTAAMRHRLEAARERLAQLTEQVERPGDDASVASGDDSARTASNDASDDPTEDAANPDPDDNGHA